MDNRLIEMVAEAILELNAPPPAGRGLRTTHIQARWLAETALSHAEGAAQRQLAEMAHTVEMHKGDVANLEADLRGKRLVIGQLRSENARLLAEHSYAEEALAVFNYWNAVVKNGKAKSFAGARERAVIRALKDYDVLDLLKACDGAKHDAYTDAKGKKFDDLEFICRDGKNIERFIEAAERRDDAVQDIIDGQLSIDSSEVYA